MKFSIDSVELSNYRQFRGYHRLNFRYDPEKNVSIILGNNGAGKSNILNAITWCFYGIEVHTDTKVYKSSDMPIVNASVVSEMHAGQHASAEVKITLRTEEGPWVIERKVVGYKNSVGLLSYQPGNLKVVRMIDGKLLTDEGESTQILINKLLPVDLRSFFFIDGEQLREFFRYTSPEKVAKAVEQVSQLEMIERADEHLRDLKRRVRKEVQESTPQLEVIHKKIEANEERLKENLQAIAVVRPAVEAWRTELQEIREYLSRTNNGNLKNLVAERAAIERDGQALEKDLLGVSRDKHRYLVGVAPFIYLKKEIEAAKALIEENIETKTRLRAISRDLIDSILSEGTCICGKEIDDEARALFQSYSNELLFSDLRDTIVSGNNRYEDIQKILAGFGDILDGYNARIGEKRHQIEAKNRRLVQIKEAILALNEDEITGKEVLRDELLKKISSKEQTVKILENNNQVYRRANEELQKEEEREIFKDRKNVVLQKKLELIDSALRVFHKTSKEIKVLVRSHVEKTTEHNFFALIRKKEAFREVDISETYEVTVRHVKGFNVIDHLSAGEYMILGLSFMSSLMTISGFKAPVIIDTPLGKIDKEHRDHITAKLPQFVEGTQLILLVTPTEYDDMVETNLGKYLIPENFYEIQENTANTESMVVAR